MAALSPLFICALCFGHAARLPCRQRFRADIARAAERFALPRRWICAVIKTESGGHLRRDGAPIVSAKGAMGLMQLMPHTFKAMAQRYGLPADPFAPKDNILAGTAYLYRCYVRFGFPLLFSAYVAGPSPVENFIEHGVPLSRQTRDYVRQVLHALSGSVTLMVPLKPRVAPTLFIAASHGAGFFTANSSALAAGRNPAEQGEKTALRHGHRHGR